MSKTPDVDSRPFVQFGYRDLPAQPVPHVQPGPQGHEGPQEQPRSLSLAAALSPLQLHFSVWLVFWLVWFMVVLRVIPAL